MIQRFPHGDEVDERLVALGYPPDHPIHAPDETTFLVWLEGVLIQAAAAFPAGKQKPITAVAKVVEARYRTGDFR